MVAEKPEEKKQKDEMSFFDHLDVLRKHIIRGIISVILFAIAAFFFKHILFDEILFAPKDAGFITNDLLCRLGEYLEITALCINEKKIALINFEVAGQFSAHIVVSLVAGFIAAFPYVMHQLWRFIRPALQKKERRYTRGMLFVTSLLFFVGVLFGYFLIVPLTINFLSNYEVSAQLEDMYNFRNYISLVTTIALSTGLVFELPVLIYFLSKIGIMTPMVLKKYRRHAFVLTFIVSGIITPPDVFSQILVALPLYFLYEMSISISKKVYRKQQRAMAG
ncbi:MAG: twin-arginine translocase subunit TatC [Bacteroidota bacterium]